MDLDFHNTRGVLYPNTQPNGLGYGRGIFLYRDPCVDLDFHNTHESLCPNTPKPGVPVANGSVCVRMPLI